MSELLSARIRKSPPRTQEDACLLAAQESIAALGPAKTVRDIRYAALGMARGMFGEAYKSTSRRQRKIWVNMCETAYRIALHLDPSP
jgi:hypothetical protein